MPKLPEQDPFLTDVTQSKNAALRSQATSPDKTLKLPPGMEPPEVSYRYEVNPAMALSLLSEIQIKVIELQKKLRNLVSQIQTVYAEGPVVDGWLESAKVMPETAAAKEQSDAADRALLRHADVDALMAYVQALEDSASVEAENPEELSQEGPTYRLCRLDESGQVLSRPCPPEQVAAVSMAIARHQQLTQLVEQRLVIEDKLKRLVNALRRAKQALADV